MNYVDPSGLFGWTDKPTIPQPLLDFSTGVADAASLGLGPLARKMIGVDGGVDRCSKAYSTGEWASLGLAAGRIAYAGIAKLGTAVAADGIAAMVFRNKLKRVMRGPLAGSNFRIKNYGDLLKKYGSDAAIQNAAGRTNAAVNAVGAKFRHWRGSRCGEVRVAVMRSRQEIAREGLLTSLFGVAYIPFLPTGNR